MPIFRSVLAIACACFSDVSMLSRQLFPPFWKHLGFVMALICKQKQQLTSLMKENMLLLLLTETTRMFHVFFLRQKAYKVRAGGLAPAQNMSVGAPVETEGPSSQTPAKALLPLCSLWTCTKTHLPPWTRCLLSWATRKVSESSTSRPEALPQTHISAGNTSEKLSENNFKMLLFSVHENRTQFEWLIMKYESYELISNMNYWASEKRGILRTIASIRERRHSSRSH